MKLSQVLAKVSGPENEKTASVTSTTAAVQPEKTAGASPTGDKLLAALKEATAPAPQGEEKKAAANSPVQDLTKLAGDIAAQSHEALTKEAQFYGASVADGFMARLAQYNEAAEKIAAQQPRAIPGELLSTLKTASTDDSFEKFAAENPDLVKQAAEVGYDRTIGQVQKLAEAAYAKGHDEATEAIYKLAHQSFITGYGDTANLLQEMGK